MEKSNLTPAALHGFHHEKAAFPFIYMNGLYVWHNLKTSYYRCLTNCGGGGGGGQYTTITLHNDMPLTLPERGKKLAQMTLKLELVIGAVLSRSQPAMDRSHISCDM